MASVPAEVNRGGTGQQDQTGSEGSPANRSNLFLGFNRLSLMRQVALLFAVAASVALGIALVLWVQQPNYQPVLGDMSQYDPQNVAQILDQAGIDYRIQPSSGALLVPSDEVFKARMKLAAAGVTNNKTVGFELLDKSQGLGTSQFMEMARYRQALEGELERTIASLQAVRSARVHLAIPKQSVFVNDNRKPSASVFVDVFAGQRLSPEQVKAIVNLVASSVPQMGRKDVTVVDQKGNLLTEDDSQSPIDQQADTQLQYTRNYEHLLNRRIANLLRPIVGDGRFRSEVSADLDFSSQEQAQELYNPDQKALRSEHTVDEKRTGNNGEGGIPGALSNQPPSPAQAGGGQNNSQATSGRGGQSGSSSQTQTPTDIRQQATRNYELDRTLNYTRRAVGDVQRLTVAVAVDDIKSVDPKTGKVSYKPWSKSQLQRLTMLVRDAVGYSAARGDSVTVVNTAFAPEEKATPPTVHFWEQDWFLNAIRPAAGVLIVLVIALVLVRPTLKNLAASGRTARDRAVSGGLDEFDSYQGGSAIRDALSHSDDLLLPGGGAGYDRQLNTLKGLIAEDPARVAQVIRQWVNADD